MPWARFDDDLLTNDKYLGASVEAKLLWHTSIIYCAKNLTDGFIREAILPALGRIAGVGAVGPIRDELLNTRLWDQAEGGIIVHDYLEYNPTKAEVLALREARADAGARGGKQKASNRLASAKQEPEQMLSKDVAKTYPVPGPVPVPGPLPGNPDPEPLLAGADAPAKERKPRVKSVAKETEPDKQDDKERRAALFDAFVRGQGWDASRLSTNDRGQINYAIKTLEPAHATPEEIDLAYSRYPLQLKGCNMTPPAVAKHFSTLIAGAHEAPSNGNGLLPGGMSGPLADDDGNLLHLPPPPNVVHTRTKPKTPEEALEQYERLTTINAPRRGWDA